MADDKRQAVVTVTSDRFVVGTAVLLDSFCRQNPWFDGDLLVLHGSLSRAAAEKLHELVPRARLRAASPDLASCLDKLVQACPRLATRRDRFLSLDTFSLAGHERLLFLDSDMLVTGSFRDLFDRADPLLACPDGAWLRGNARHRETYAEVARIDGDEILRQTFNAGMLCFDGAMANPATWATLLDQLDPVHWAAVTADHTDQRIFNIAFADRVTLVGPEWNLMLGHHEDSHRSRPVALSDAKALHFNGPGKPWAVDKALAGAFADPVRAEAQALWLAAYRRLAGSRRVTVTDV